jgi:hypothetical protein
MAWGAASAAAPQSDAQSALTFAGNLGHPGREDETRPPLVHRQPGPENGSHVGTEREVVDHARFLPHVGLGLIELHVT